MRQLTATSATKRVAAGPPRWIRDLALATGVATLAMGVWAFLFPEHFFSDFPIAGAEWVSTLGAYNEHLMRDYGASQIGLGVAAIGVALARSTKSVASVMLGYVIFGTLHLGYHAGNFGAFATGSAVSQATALITFIAIPAAALVGIWNYTKKGINS
ncbi:MAG: hypothetical protein WBM90_07490 [Acidimicrobiia bacterium]